jgi:hypothetical protein
VNYKNICAKETKFEKTIHEQNEKFDEEKNINNE